MLKIIGWDIGGVNSKAALINYENGKFKNLKLFTKYFPVFKYKRKEFIDILREIYDELCINDNAEWMAVTITAELSDAFFNKREGLEFITKCFNDCFPEKEIYFLDNKGTFSKFEDIKQNILRFAATNWIATAALISEKYGNCLMIDIGSTTTDIIPIINGKFNDMGLTDLDRLISGELVYTGVLRATIPSITHYLEVKGKKSRISFEKFALMADVHFVLNHISEKEYNCETADDRPVDRKNCLARIARIVCADDEILEEKEILKLAKQLYEAQVVIIQEGIEQIIKKNSELYQPDFPIIVLGLGGKILAEKAVRELGFNNIIYLSDILGEEASIIAPSVAVAYMLGKFLEISK